MPEPPDCTVCGSDEHYAWCCPLMEVIEAARRMRSE
jgi:hypothetical protein